MAKGDIPFTHCSSSKHVQVLIVTISTFYFYYPIKKVGVRQDKEREKGKGGGAVDLRGDQSIFGSTKGGISRNLQHQKGGHSNKQTNKQKP